MAILPVYFCMLDRQTDRQTDNLYLSMILIKAVQLVGLCIIL